MQLDQPPPDLPAPGPTPFDHLRPTLWHASKVAHITLVSLGSLMLVPGAFVFLGLSFAMQYGGIPSLASDPQEAMALLSAHVSTCFGVLAWSALCLLFFKRNDARWQRICWAVCCAFGIVAAPSLLAWIVWLGDQFSSGSAEGWVFLIFFSMLGISVACVVLGWRYSFSARRALRHPPTEADRTF